MMRLFVILALVVVVGNVIAGGENVTGKWVDRGFAETSNPAESDFSITFRCGKQGKPFAAHDFYFKRDWQFLTPNQWGNGSGAATRVRSCGATHWKYSSFKASAKEEGIQIGFSASAGPMGTKTPEFEIKRAFNIPWKALPFSETDGEYRYSIEFTWNKPSK